MNASEIIKSIENEQLKAEAPEFSVGDTVKVYGKIKEGNRERIQVFEGTVLKRQGGSFLLPPSGCQKRGICHSENEKRWRRVNNLCLRGHVPRKHSL